MTEDHSAQRFHVGQRVAPRESDCGSARRGTVRYLGTVDGTDDCWVGVDWDDGLGGKHDGARAGRRYFRCLEGPTAGSFARAAHLSAGVSAYRALSDRYAAPAGASSFESGFGKPIEVVGIADVARRVGRLFTLRTISLATERVNGVGSADDAELLRRNAGSVVSLDLSASLLPSWQALRDVVANTPALECLLAKSVCAEVASR